jgi:hypothetical protein
MAGVLLVPELFAHERRSQPLKIRTVWIQRLQNRQIDAGSIILFGSPLDLYDLKALIED